MKTLLEMDDVQLIVTEVIKSIKPLLQENTQTEGNTNIFDVRDLAEYLRIDESWVYKQAALHQIPFFKAGKYLRFQKTAIDKWIQENSSQQIPSLQLPRKGGEKRIGKK